MRKRIIGYLGLVLLILAYVCYGLLQKEYLFIITNILATILLTIYAFLNRDLIFTFVNLFIVVMLLTKFVKS